MKSKTPEHHLCEVIILTALQVECQAVLHHLQELQEIVHPSGTIYHKGIFPGKHHTWHIAVAEVGMGGGAAALEAEKALTFFSAHIALFVGIAGGFKDVRRGDVVAATKVYAYEAGKVTQRFETRPEIGHSSHALVQRARAEAHHDEWLARLDGPHPDPAPQVFIGALAAGEKVFASKQSSLYRLLKASYGDTLAIEMEGHGFLHAVRVNHAVHGLVIRGISDLINDKPAADASGAQTVAARHAAAFAFQVLATLTFSAWQDPITTTNDTPPSQAKVDSGEASIEIGIDVKDEWFYGREDKLVFFESFLSHKYLGVQCLSVYGFAGAGKSAFLREAVRKAHAKGFKVIGKRVVTVGPQEPLAGFASRIAKIENKNPFALSDYEILSQFADLCFIGKSILAVDEFKFQDTKFVADFNWLLELAESKNCSVIVLIACREKPLLKSTLQVQYTHILPFSLEQTAVLVSQWDQDNRLLGLGREVFLASSGYPQLIQYICRNHEVAAKVLKGAIIEFDVLKEVWLQIKASALHQPAELLSVLGEFSKEYLEQVGDELIVDWPNVRDDLLDRSLIEAVAVDVYKMHDLLRNYIYNKIGKIRKRDLHILVGKHFLSQNETHLALIAFYHFVAAEDVQDAKLSYTKIRDMLRLYSYSPLNITSIQQLLKLVRNTDFHFSARLYEDLGFIHLMTDAYDAAAEDFTEAIGLCDLTHQLTYETEDLGWCNWGLGVIYRMKANFSEALHLYQIAENLFRITDEKRGLAWTLRERCEVLKSIGENVLAEQTAKQALNMSELAKDEFGKVAALRIFADFQTSKCRFDKALDIHHQAVKLSKQLSSKMNEGYNLNAIAHILRLMGKYHEAIEYSKQSLLVLETIYDRAGICFSQFGYAETLRLLNRYDAAENEYATARLIAQQINHLDFELYIVLGIGEILRAKKKYHQALEAYRYSHEGAIKYGLKLVEGHSLLSIAELERLKGNFDVNAYDKALEVYEIVGSNWGIVHTLIGKALSAHGSGNELLFDHCFARIKEICEEYSLSYELELITHKNSYELHPICFSIV